MVSRYARAVLAKRHRFFRLRLGELLESLEARNQRHVCQYEPFHLFGYLDEQSFRYNERHDTDAERFHKVLGSVAGKRLTWNHLTSQGVG